MNNLASYRLCAGLPAPPAGKLLYVYLTEISDNRGGVAISVRRLANSMGLSRSSVRRNLQLLRRIGMLCIMPRYTGDGGRLSNKYILR